MVLTNEKKLAEKLRRCRSHGITRDSNEFAPVSKDEIWNYQQIELGFNYRMTDIQAALGISQLQRLDQFLAARKKIAKNYNDMFSDTEIQLPFQLPGSCSSYHLYPIRLFGKSLIGKQRDVVRRCYEAGINVNIHYMPVYLHPYFERLGFSRGYCPQAEAYFTEAVSLPIFPNLSVHEQEKVVQVVKEAIV